MAHARQAIERGKRLADTPAAQPAPGARGAVRRPRCRPGSHGWPRAGCRASIAGADRRMPACGRSIPPVN